MHAFLTDMEFNQASLDNVARLVSDRASTVIASGNVADVSQEVLESLESLAIELSLNPTVIATFLEIISSENELLKDF